MNREPLVSVVIPVFNAERTIERTLRSVLEQSYRNIEIIVVDDGSSDASTAIVKGILDDRINLIEQSNGRAGAARNLGYSISKGDWIIFIDSDDVIIGNHIGALVEAVVSNENGVDFVVAASRWTRLYPDGSVELPRQRPTYATMPGIEWLLLDWASDYMTQCGMFLLPRRIIECFGGWRPELSFGPNDDFEFFSRILVQVKKIVFAEAACLYYMSGQPGSLSTLNHESAIARKLESLALGTSHVLKVEDSERVRLAVANIHQRFVYEHYPRFPSLLKQAQQYIKSMGGSNLRPIGPPGFQIARLILGWRMARRAQMFAEMVREWFLRRRA